MCGISGVYTNELTEQHEQIVNDIMLSQTARGPDYQDKCVLKGSQAATVLAHNRLSIIDLSSHANQPMWDSTGRYCIVYNGEIYNYLELTETLIQSGLTFQTQSDTEVILNAFAHWGIAALHHFQGPFAFALYDTHLEELWLCRDRFGIRPLYYIEQNGALYFASTTRALAQRLNLKPNLQYVAKGLKYLVYEDASDMTAYLQLHSLPAACYLQAKMTSQQKIKCEIKTYYELNDKVEHLIEQLASSNANALLESINHTLENAVNVRLRTDVPLAISLSGGLDSSSVAALVSRQHANTIGFSFSHPTQKQTEGPLVAQCAKQLKINIQYVWPSAQQMIDAFYQTIEIQDAPFSTFSIVAQNLLYQQVRRLGIKVLLGGQGGDEAFMGYKKFLLFWLQQSVKQKRYLLTAKNFLQMMPMFFSEMTSLTAYWQHRHRYWGGNKQSDSALRLPSSWPLSLGNHASLLWKRQLQDITQFSLPTLLRYEDRNAMGNSVESRLPYMDYRLIELGLALPESMKLKAGYGKWAIRKIMENKIPDSIRLARYKRGFDTSSEKLIQAGLGRSIRDTLHQRPSVTKEFLQPSKTVNEAFSDQQLMQRKGAISEAISLLWLNKVIT